LNLRFFFAALISLPTCAVHMIRGGRKLHVPMLTCPPDTPTKKVWSVVWHGVTAMLALATAAVISDAAAAMAAAPVGLSGAFAAHFFGCGVRRLGSIPILPQWIAFVLIAGPGLAEWAA
jgi:hypothetical protein